jgi:hypothetical protein
VRFCSYATAADFAQAGSFTRSGASVVSRGFNPVPPLQRRGRTVAILHPYIRNLTPTWPEICPAISAVRLISLFSSPSAKIVRTPFPFVRHSRSFEITSIP